MKKLNLLKSGFLLTFLLGTIVVFSQKTNNISSEKTSILQIAVPFNFENPNFTFQKGTILKPSGPVDLVITDGMIDGADYLQHAQADVTEDNAGNGASDTDPDDGGWDWSLTSPVFTHSAAPSPKNIYGATAQGLYYAYLATSDAGYKTAMQDAATVMIGDASIRTASDLIFLMNFQDITGVTADIYKAAAKAKFDGRIVTHGSATALAADIRDDRAGQGYQNGIIPWDIGAWAVAAAMLEARYPADPYDYAQAADDIAEVLYQDSFMDNLGYFDIIDDQGWDPTYTNKNYWWYSLGITGLIDAFNASGLHTDKIPGLITILNACQYSGGAFSFSYGAHDNDEDWQSTAYSVASLARVNQATYQEEINKACFWLLVTQDPVSGGWVYSDETHYPEVAGENAAAMYFGNIDPTPVTTIETPTVTSCGVYDVDVRVHDFINVGAISLKLIFDPLVFAYQTVGVTLNPAIPSTAVANVSITGKFILGYFGDENTPGITLEENAILFTLHFTLLQNSGLPTQLTWSTAQGACDYSSPNGEVTYVSSFIGNTWTIPVFPNPTITGPATPCKLSTGNVYTTETGMTGYDWTVSAGGTITAGGNGFNSVTVTWGNPGVESVTVNYTDGNGCTAATPTVKNVTVLGPTITGPVDVCRSTTTPYTTYTYTTESGKTSYDWTYAGAALISGGGGDGFNYVTLRWTATGPRNVIVTYTDGTCTQTTTLPVTVHPNTPGMTGSNIACLNGTETYNSTGPENINLTYVVSPGGTVVGGGNPADQFITILWTTVGSKTITVTMPSPYGCTMLPTNFPVTVYALPVPTLSGPSSVCKNSTGNVYTTEAGKTNYDWIVSAGGTKTSGGGTGDNTVTVTWHTDGPQTVSVDYSDSHYCNAATPTVQNVMVNSLPAPAISGAINACASSTGNTYTTAFDALHTYSWTIDGGVIVGSTTGNSISVTWGTGLAGWVKVTETITATGCAVTTEEYDVTIDPLPVPTITGPATPCKLSTGNVYSTEVGMTGYDWTVSAGGTITAGGDGSNSVTVTWGNPGAESVQVNYIDGNGCTAATATNQVVTVLGPTITGPATVCKGTTGNVYTTESGKTGYTWVYTGAIMTAGGNGFNYVTLTWTASGSRSVKVTYTDGACTSQTTYPVYVNKIKPDLLGDSRPCQGTVATYTTDPGETGYDWTVSAGGAITGGGDNWDFVNILWNTAGSQTVTVIYNTPVSGCTMTPTVALITIDPAPVPGLSGPSPVCINSTGNVYTTEAGMLDYVWYVSPGGTKTLGGNSTDNTVTVTWNTAGPQTVSVGYTRPFVHPVSSCTSITPTVQNVTVNPLRTVSGKLKYYNNNLTPMDTVTLKLTPGPVYKTTEGGGNYSFPDLCDGTYTIEVTNINKPAGGINATDAAQVNAWGVAGPVYPNIEKVRFFAGDVITNNFINSSDAGRILQYFVQAGNPAFSTTKWKFWWAGDMSTSNPPAGSTIISVAVAGDVSKDLYGMSTGDFNRSFIPDIYKAVSGNLTLNYAQTMQVETGTEFELPINAGMDMEVGAVSLIMNFPSDNVEITGVFLSSDPNSPVMYNVSGDELRIGWNTLAPVWLNEGESLITLKMKVNDQTGNGSIYFSLAADPLNELADGDYEVIGNAVLTIDVVKASALGFGENSLAENLTLSNHPNPFNGATTFVYSIPVDGKVILEIYDLVGNKVKVAVDETQSAGTYSLKLDANQLQPGVYTATIKLKNTDTAITRTIKIISK